MTGGIFHDCAVHDIDVVCWILGEFPDVVYTQAHAFHKNVAELGDVDQVNITMKFASGIIATIDLNREASYGYDQRIEVNYQYSKFIEGQSTHGQGCHDRAMYRALSSGGFQSHRGWVRVPVIRSELIFLNETLHYKAWQYDQKYFVFSPQVFGSNGMLETRNNSKINLVGHLGKNGASSDPVPFSFPQRYADAYREELDYFIDYVLGKRKQYISLG